MDRWELLDEPPWSQTVTPYDEEHFELYLQLLDAFAAGCSTEEIALRVLGSDVSCDPAQVKCLLESHLRRAQWMTEVGYRQLIR